MCPDSSMQLAARACARAGHSVGAEEGLAGMCWAADMPAAAVDVVAAAAAAAAAAVDKVLDAAVGKAPAAAGVAGMAHAAAAAAVAVAGTLLDAADDAAGKAHAAVAAAVAAAGTAPDAAAADTFHDSVALGQSASLLQALVAVATCWMPSKARNVNEKA